MQILKHWFYLTPSCTRVEPQSALPRPLNSPPPSENRRSGIGLKAQSHSGCLKRPSDRRRVDYSEPGFSGNFPVFGVVRGPPPGVQVKKYEEFSGPSLNPPQSPTGWAGSIASSVSWITGTCSATSDCSDNR